MEMKKEIFEVRFRYALPPLHCDGVAGAFGDELV